MSVPKIVKTKILTFFVFRLDEGISRLLDHRTPGNIIIVFVSTQQKGANKNNEVKSLCENKKMFYTRIKIMWEEQLVDPPIHYLTCVIAP